MPWGNGWPPERGDPLGADAVINQVRAALAERDGLVPAGFVPGAFARWDPLRGTPHGGQPPHATIANFQYEVQETLGLVWPLRWWDLGRDVLYTFQNLCQDAFGQDGWSCDLTATDGQGNPANRWAPAFARLFEELYRAIGRLDRVRMLPSASESVRRDSVYRLTFGIADWPQNRADTFALFDGEDDEVSAGLAYHVGMGGELYDDGFTQQWFLESRELRTRFATGALEGYAAEKGWLDFTTEPPGGAADFADTFTAEVVDGEGTPLGTFSSDDYGPKRIEVPGASIKTDADTHFAVRSTRPDAEDRPAWNPQGPNYTSTYREGLAIAGPIRLIVEVVLEYRG